MPQGEKRGSEIDLYDKIYDGHEENHYLYGGLGQLVDSQKGPDNFRLDIRGQGKGYEWVGWRNDTGVQRPIEVNSKLREVTMMTPEYTCIYIRSCL